jgi:hypothetical protein
MDLLQAEPAGIKMPEVETSGERGELAFFKMF